MTGEPQRRRRPRRLSDDERILWSEVVRNVAPLPGRQAEQVQTPQVEPDVEAPAKSAISQAKHKPTSTPRAQAEVPAPPPLAPLGRRMRSRIARGGHAIDGRIDLHGLTQREAHTALLGFLRTAQTRGAGIVLVITGKGRSGEGERGVLKRQVPQWLRLPEFRTLIVGFEDAHIAHGGEGALYVQVRRAKR